MAPYVCRSSRMDTDFLQKFSSGKCCRYMYAKAALGDSNARDKTGSILHIYVIYIYNAYIHILHTYTYITCLWLLMFSIKEYWRNCKLIYNSQRISKKQETSFY